MDNKLGWRHVLLGGLFLLILPACGLFDNGGNGAGAPAGAISDPLASKPQIVTDGSGNFMAAWHAGISIQTRYYPNGNGEPVIRIGEGRASDDDPAPNLTASSNGNFFVVWEGLGTFVNSVNGTQVENVLGRRFIKGLNIWEDMMPPNRGGSSARQNLVLPQVLTPFVGANTSGDHFAVWIENATALSSPQTPPGLFLSRRDDADANWTFACRYDSFFIANFPQPIMPQVVVDERHAVGPFQNEQHDALIVWTSSDPARPGLFAVRAPQRLEDTRRLPDSPCILGRFPGPAFVQLAVDDIKDTNNPFQIATNHNGTAIVVWGQDRLLISSGNGIHAIRYDFANDQWSTPLQLQPQSTGPGAFSNPQIAMNDSSNAIALWIDKTANRIVARHHQGGVDFASAWGPPIEISDAAAIAGPHVSIDANGNAIAVWEQAGEIHANRYDASQGLWLGPAKIGGGKNPKVAIDANGMAIAVWERDGFIFDFIWGRPTAAFTFSPTIPAPNAPVTFDAGLSRADTGTITLYEWDFEDDGVFDGTGLSATHSYPAAGDFSVRLRVTDSNGVTSSTTAVISVGQYPLTVSKTGDGTGTVTSNDGLINCGAVCSETYRHGDRVTLSALPDSGFVFSEWNCGGTPAANPVIPLVMNGPTSCAATFTAAPGSFTLTVAVNSGGRVMIGDSPCTPGESPCSRTFSPGTVVTLTALPDPAELFPVWGGCDSTNLNTCTVTMDANKEVTVFFTLG